jgi:hypothetical protein
MRFLAIRDGIAEVAPLITYRASARLLDSHSRPTVPASHMAMRWDRRFGLVYRTNNGQHFYRPSNSEWARTVESGRSGARDERTDPNSPPDKCKSKAIGRYHSCNTWAGYGYANVGTLEHPPS